jgi:DNA-binding transcriptional regulator YiaG
LIISPNPVFAMLPMSLYSELYTSKKSTFANHFPIDKITELSYTKSIMKEWNADEIKQLRTRYGITQRAFADLLGVTRVYVGLLERRDKTPSTSLKLLLNYVERDLRERENEKGKGGTHGRAKGKKGTSKRDL